MNSLSKAVKNFVKLLDALLYTFCEKVIENLTGNAFFTTPTVSLVTLQATLDAYGAAITAAANGDRVKIAAKNTLKAQLITELRAECDYVNAIAKGSREMVISSGFDPNKISEKQYIYAPPAPKVTQGVNPGSLISKTKKVKGSIGSLHQILAVNAPAGTEWDSYPSSRNTYEFDKLESGVKYRVRVVILGSGDQVAYSPETVQYAL